MGSPQFFTFYTFEALVQLFFGEAWCMRRVRFESGLAESLLGFWCVTLLIYILAC
jgi:hypothetical protein